ncbi:CBO0543 family protein [Bacillus sp. DJP31]|uniref:CBO0543 family protein n=1 Tax=Bacillus sp. DJP31 TaxID=3409789 RepID=UPI003BB612E1
MHLLLALSLIVIIWVTKAYKDIGKYSLTIYYVITSNLLYNVLCKDYLLWEYKPDFLPKSHVFAELLHTFITLPAITLLFLTSYPYGLRKLVQAGYITKWVGKSLLVEALFLLADRLILHNGYQTWMEIPFYLNMYGMLRLHQSKPILTYILSIGLIAFLLWYFKVPIT